MTNPLEKGVYKSKKAKDNLRIIHRFKTSLRDLKIFLKLSTEYPDGFPRPLWMNLTADSVFSSVFQGCCGEIHFSPNQL